MSEEVTGNWDEEGIIGGDWSKLEGTGLIGDNLEQTLSGEDSEGGVPTSQTAEQYS